MSFDPVYLDRTSRHAYPPAVAALVRRFAGVRPGMTVVELGCGTGFWGRLLAAGLRGRGRLVGLDVDPALLEHARSQGSALGGVSVDYREGDAAASGLPAGCADLVTCHRLLTVVPDPARVVAEMLRLAAPGGRVLVNEHDHSKQLFWDPDDPGLAELRARGLAAQQEAARSLDGRDVAVATRLPALLLEAGLRDLRLLGLLVPYGPLPFDRSVPATEVGEHFEWLLRRTLEGSPEVWAAEDGAGWSVAEEREYGEREARAIRGRLESPRALRRWGRLTLVPRLLVRGRAPRSG
jgi:SAM-dependent methyltransferase